MGPSSGKKKITKLTDEYGQRDYGFPKKTNLERFLKRNSKEHQFKTGNRKSYQKGFKPTAKQKWKGESHKVESSIRKSSNAALEAKKNFKTLQIQTIFEQEEMKNEGDLKETNSIVMNQIARGENISFADNSNISHKNVFENDLNIYSRQKK